jgi:hypothetical protein
MIPKLPVRIVPCTASRGHYRERRALPWAAEAEREAVVARQPQEASRQGPLERREVWMQVLPLRPVASAQTAQSVGSQKAAYLPDRWP